MSAALEVDPNDPSTWGLLTPSTQRLHDLVGINPKPRRLTPEEIELLVKSKQEIALRCMQTPTHPRKI